MLATISSGAGWLFGPVLGYDLVRTARRNRFFWLRTVYATAMLFLLLAVYIYNQDTNFSHYTVRRGTMAQLAEKFFFACTWVQIGVVVLLTPIYAAGAIAEEKETRTLEFLLTTDLRSREIVLSKLLSRVANLTLLLLTGLPILTLVQLWGGVDPDLVLAEFAAIGLTLVSLTSVSVLLSVYAPKPWTAIVLTYLVTGAYLGASSLCLLLLASPRVALFELVPGDEPLTVQDLVRNINVGNPLGAWYQLRESLRLRKPLVEVIPGLLGRYALFHGLVTLVCVVWAVARLRPATTKQTLGPGQGRLRRLWFRARPRVGNLPMVWKEVFFERGISSPWLGRIILCGIILATFAPALWIIADFAFEITGKKPSSWQESSWWLPDAINQWVRWVGTLVACLTMLGVAVRAAGSITGERDRQTLDNLLTSPLTSSAILLGKWLGSVLSMRWAWLWLVLIWLVGVGTGGLSLVTLPWLALC